MGKLAALEERFGDAERTIHDQARTIEHQAKAIHELNDAVKALQAGLSRLAQQQMKPRTSEQPTSCGAKRRSVLGDASNLSTCARLPRSAPPTQRTRSLPTPRLDRRPCVASAAGERIARAAVLALIGNAQRLARAPWRQRVGG